ncbi:MAG: cellulase family glycosylhydrolase [Candidatus Saccharimonadales bacterium]
MVKRSIPVIHHWLRTVALVALCGVTVGYLLTTSAAPVAFAPRDGIDKNGAVVLRRPDSRTVAPDSHANSYGFSANEVVWMDAGRRAQQLDAMKAAGVTWVRIDMQWYTVQPSNANSYDWSVYDRAIDAINQHGLKTLAILDYAPAWAATNGCRPNISHKCAPADPQAFATYAAAAASRYTARGVTSWEIWNEQNSPRFWYPTVDATAYANLLKATYPAIKKVNPTATVITGGLKSADAEDDINPADYMLAVYNAGGQPYFDALAAHPYTYPDLPSQPTRSNGWMQMLQIYDVAVSQGDATKQIWMTEVGATTGGPHPVSDNLQAQIVDDAIRLHNSYSWAGPLFWYDYQDLGTNPAKGEDFYGLVRANGSRKPAYTSFILALRRLET